MVPSSIMVVALRSQVREVYIDSSADHDPGRLDNQRGPKGRV